MAKYTNLAGMILEGTRVQGFRGSSRMLKNYINLKAWQKSYELCLEILRIKAKFPRVHSKKALNKSKEWQKRL